MSASWTMSSLMKNTVTQENPIYNINVPPPPTDSSTTSDITPVVVTQAAEQVDESTIVAITTLPAVPSNETLSFLEIKKKKKGNVPQSYSGRMAEGEHPFLL